MNEQQKNDLEALALFVLLFILLVLGIWVSAIVGGNV